MILIALLTYCNHIEEVTYYVKVFICMRVRQAGK